MRFTSDASGPNLAFPTGCVGLHPKHSRNKQIREVPKKDNTDRSQNRALQVNKEIDRDNLERLYFQIFLL